MRQIELTGQRLREADGVAGVLAAGWEIFELIGGLAAACAEQAADLYPAFMFARSAAADGRNAIAFAPSAPAVGTAFSGDAEAPGRRGERSRRRSCGTRVGAEHALAGHGAAGGG